MGRFRETLSQNFEGSNYAWKGFKESRGLSLAFTPLVALDAALLPVRMYLDRKSHLDASSDERDLERLRWEQGMPGSSQYADYIGQEYLTLPRAEPSRHAQELPRSSHDRHKHRSTKTKGESVLYSGWSLPRRGHAPKSKLENRSARSEHECKRFPGSRIGNQRDAAPSAFRGGDFVDSVHTPDFGGHTRLQNSSSRYQQTQQPTVFDERAADMNAHDAVQAQHRAMSAFQDQAQYQAQPQYLNQVLEPQPNNTYGAAAPASPNQQPAYGHGRYVQPGSVQPSNIRFNQEFVGLDAQQPPEQPQTGFEEVEQQYAPSAQKRSHSNRLPTRLSTNAHSTHRSSRTGSIVTAQSAIKSTTNTPDAKSYISQSLHSHGTRASNYTNTTWRKPPSSIYTQAQYKPTNREESVGPWDSASQPRSSRSSNRRAERRVHSSNGSGRMVESGTGRSSYRQPTVEEVSESGRSGNRASRNGIARPHEAVPQSLSRTISTIDTAQLPTSVSSRSRPTIRTSQAPSYGSNDNAAAIPGAFPASPQPPHPCPRPDFYQASRAPRLPTQGR